MRNDILFPDGYRPPYWIIKWDGEWYFAPNAHSPYGLWFWEI